MRKHFVVAMLAVVLLVCGLNVQGALATSPNLVISHLQLGDAVSASDEFVEVYNNGQTDTDITNWCLYYASATSLQIGSKLGCFVPSGENFHLYLPSYSYAFAASTVLLQNQPNIGSDITFSAGLSGTAGHVRIVDAMTNEVDRVGWGLGAALPETLFATAPSAGNILQRKHVPSSQALQDTDNNSADFEVIPAMNSYTYGSLYEVEDICTNILGVQATVPDGLTTDGSGNCLPPPADLCTNIDGLQTEVPSGYLLDADGLCQADACANLDSLQTSVPDGYYLNDQAICMLDLKPLRLNEILPNPVGSDDGNEFIELFNPNNVAIDLTQYRLQIGSDTPKVYSFPATSVVPALGYSVFSNNDIAFTLVNSAGVISLISADNQIVDTPPPYSNAADGMAWALINGMWQYTNQPTPGSQNLPSVEPDSVETIVATTLKPCASNQYRSPDTNRCRLIVTSSGSTLAPCKDGQYRSEITNRCRSIAADVNALTPCAANQERNPDTNRCRLVASTAAALSVCKPGQERSPDTNRCRTVASTAVPSVGFAVEPIADSPSVSIGWWVAGGAAVVAFAYGIWEWHVEVGKLFHKVRSFIPARK
jgi:hypothetical protein